MKEEPRIRENSVLFARMGVVVTCILDIPETSVTNISVFE